MSSITGNASDSTAKTLKVGITSLSNLQRQNSVIPISYGMNLTVENSGVYSVINAGTDFISSKTSINKRIKFVLNGIQESNMRAGDYLGTAVFRISY